MSFKYKQSWYTNTFSHISSFLWKYVAKAVSHESRTVYPSNACTRSKTTHPVKCMQFKYKQSIKYEHFCAHKPFPMGTWFNCRIIWQLKHHPSKANTHSDPNTHSLKCMKFKCNESIKCKHIRLHKYFQTWTVTKTFIQMHDTRAHTINKKHTLVGC